MKQLAQYCIAGLAIALLCLTACLTACTAAPPQPHPQMQLKVVPVDPQRLVAGQTVYVPIYAYIYTENQQQNIELSATLSIRNTDLNYPIIITTASYYNTQGTLIKKYLQQPVELPALATVEFVIDRTDVSGGAGAKFIVEWATEQKVSVPVIEAVMINTMGNQGISFVSEGRVIKSLKN